MAYAGASQIFVRDRRRRTTELVSVAAAGGEALGASGSPSISSSGRYVAFGSDASDLVPDDSNGVPDVFVRDRTAGTTTLVSVGPGGVPADGASELPSISANGRVVAFLSRARNLGGTDTTDTTDVFIRDLGAGTTVKASAGLGGAEANGPSFAPYVSGDGTTVVFASGATNLVSDDTNGRIDVFAYDRASGTVRRLNLTPSGGEADGDTLRSGGGPVTNANASVVAFGTTAPNLLGAAASGFDLVTRDIPASTVQRLSTGAQLENIYEEAESAGPSISGAGGLVAFASAGEPQLPAYLDGSTMDVYVRDRATGALTRVSQLSQCRAAGGINGFPALSADGRFVAFQSNAIDLLQPGVYEGGTPTMHVYVARTTPPAGTEICALSVRPRTIHPSRAGSIRITLSRRGSFRIRIYRLRHNRLHRRATISGRGFDAGSHSIAFNGRIRGHTLGPGTFVAVANGSARGAPPKRVRFKIRRP